MKKETELKISQIMDECIHLENVVKSVCPHAQYCGNSSNHYYANGVPHIFLCRKKLLEYRRRDSMIIMEPFTDNQLKNSFQQYCIRHYGETCETAQGFY